MRVDYLGLEAFVAVAELGSFSKAARQLNLTQTALSHRVRKIEQELGTPLLARTSRDVALTKAGQTLLPQVRAQLETLRDLYSAARDAGRQSKKRLVFACLPTIVWHYLPDLMGEFAKRNPGVDLVLIDQPAARITEFVRTGEAEFGVTIMGAVPWDVEVEPLFEEPYVLIVNKEHRLAGRPSVTRADLVGERLVRIKTRSTNRKLVEESLGAAGPEVDWRIDVSTNGTIVETSLGPLNSELDWRFEVQNAATALGLVAAGVAVTVLPLSTIRREHPDVVGIGFSDIDFSRRIGVVVRRGSPLSPAAGRLRDMIRERLTDG